VGELAFERRAYHFSLIDLSREYQAMSIGGVSGVSSFLSSTAVRAPTRADNNGDEASESAAARAAESRTNTESSGSTTPTRGRLLNISA